MASTATKLWRATYCRSKIAWLMAMPMPGMLKMTSTTTAPPIRVPTFSPATVSSVRLDGRRAWRHSTRWSEMPLDRAIWMKSSCSVVTMSVRSRRMYTATWAAASVVAGRIMRRTCSTASSPKGT